MKTLTHFAALAALPLLLLAAPAHAQTLTLTPAAQTGASGDTLHFTGVLSNPTADTVYLNSENISLDGFATDTAPFFFDAPLSLDPMGSGNPTDSYTGGFFDVLLDPSITPGVYGGTVSILGGAAPDSLDLVASEQFTVRVLPAAPSPAVPEASTTVSMGILLMLGSLGVMQARVRAKRRLAL